MNTYGGYGTGTPGPMHGAEGQGDVHETVGAYALGILDDAEASVFETHLATCDWCAQQLDELAGMEPMLAALADLPGARGMPAHGTPAIGTSLSARPSPRLVNRLVDEVAERRAQKRRRGMYMVAASAAMIIGGPVTARAVTNGGEPSNEAKPLKSSPAEDSFFNGMTEKLYATDPATKVSATVGMERKTWGTHTVLELKNLKGPQKCSLIAVGINGDRETVSSWSVPKSGYGIKDGTDETAKKALYVHGAASMTPNEIDHFEVVTFDGTRLVELDA